MILPFFGFVDYSAESSSDFFTRVVIFSRRTTTATIATMTMKMQIIPVPMYLRFSTKLMGWNSKFEKKDERYTGRNTVRYVIRFIISTSYHMKKLRIRPPAITDAIWPETLTPMECMRRKFWGSSFRPIL